MDVLFIQLSGVVPGGGLCGGREEGICKQGVPERGFVPGIRLCHSVYSGFHGSFAGGVVLSIPGMYDCGDSDRAGDRAPVGKGFPSAVMGLYR